MPFDKSEALGKAEQHALKGDVSAAITIYRKIVESDPYDFNSINKLGDLYVGAGQIKDAVDEFSRIADLHLAGGSATRAAYLLKKTLELDPSNAPVRMKLGEVYSRENMVESAHDAFIQAGSAFMRAGDIAGALEANQKALAIKPDSPQAKAAIATLKNEAALSGSKNSHDLADSGGPDPATVAESGPPGVKRNQATGSLDHLLSGFDEDYVVRKISKAEALVGFGQVPQAVSMLKEALDSAPDNIAIHIKLKDIYLRAEMMSEACFEYQELARIYSARNETARAKDYEVRAQRLGQMIAAPAPQPEARASTGAERADHRPVVSNNGGSNRGKGSGAAKGHGSTRAAVDKTAPTGGKLAAATVRQISVTEQEVGPQPPGDSFNDSNGRNRQVKETSLAHASEPGIAMTQSSAPAPPSSFPAASVLGLTLIENHDQPPAEGKPTRRMYAAAAVVICLAAIAISAIKGLSLYDARLNKEYEELLKAGTRSLSPEQPQTLASDEPGNSEGDVVKLDPQPTQVVKSSESVKDQQEPRDAEPRFDAEAKAAPAVTQPGKPQILSPPLVTPAFDNHAGSEGNSPGGISAGVPEHPSGAAPIPAAPAAPRKASVTVPGEALKRVQPSYPLTARAARQVGTVSVEIVISENGDVVSASAISGPDLLRNAAVAAAKGWKFKPSMRDGKPVKSTSTITFNFKL